MALPSSGPLSINQIKAELGSNSTSLSALSQLAYTISGEDPKFLPPHKISDFYGFSMVNTVVNIDASGVDYNGGHGSATFELYIELSESFPSGSTVEVQITMNPSNVVSPLNIVLQAQPEELSLMETIVIDPAFTSPVTYICSVVPKPYYSIGNGSVQVSFVGYCSYPQQAYGDGYSVGAYDLSDGQPLGANMFNSQYSNTPCEPAFIAGYEAGWHEQPYDDNYGY